MSTQFSVDILVIGGGTAGIVAAIKVSYALPDAKIRLLEKDSATKWARDNETF